MWVLLLLIQSLVASAAPGEGYLCHDNNNCGSRGLLTERRVGPTKTDKIRVNPAAIPVEEITGIETIYYKGAFDFGLVKGLGRVGAAISPSNSDETFFGPPAAELPSDLVSRMDERSKYSSGKYTAGLAASLFSKGNTSLQIGGLLRYESFSKHVKPGFGLQAIVGPVYAGASYLQDEIRVTPDSFLNTALTTYSFGLSLTSILLDYSVIDVSGDFRAKASVATAALFLGRFILTGAYRLTTSDEKFYYDFDNRALLATTSQSDLFGGVQFKTTRFLILGAFYNYYLLRELSIGATVFF